MRRGTQLRALGAEFSEVVSRRVLSISAIAVWAGVITLGLYQMFSYSTASGELAETPARWPAQSQLARGSQLTVAMFVHPECPCSRASLAELAEMARGPGVATHIVFDNTTPLGALWDSAGRIAGAIRTIDDGREAARFGARTSGYTVVYDHDGVRRFAGGITGSRGHAGRNVGSDAVRQLIAGRTGAIETHAVFGCALGGPQ